MNNENLKEILFDERYYATPYDPNQDCLLSVLVCCRMSRGIGGPTDILTYLSSVFQYWRPLSQSKTEFLIKFDIDDDIAIKDLILKGKIEKLVKDHQSPSPPVIRYFIYDRWEGKKTFNYHYNYLFSQRNPKSSFITFGTDDSYYVADPIENMMLLNKTEEKYRIFIRSNCHPNVLESISDYRNKDELRKWACGDLTDPYPIVSSKIIEIAGSMGWQQNIDNWLALLGVIIYKKYGLDLFSNFPICINRKTDERVGLENRNVSNFNKELFVDDSTFPSNPYYFALIEQQAKNLYLNIRN